jgi:hypothetical protein
MNTYDYWVPLVKVDDHIALFSNPGIEVMLSIPVSNWVRMGRPGSLRVIPQPNG